MTDRQQSAFFLVIIFLFASGIGIIVYKQYLSYYQQKADVDLEVAATSLPVKKTPATTTPLNVKIPKTY